ncbi:hypothetical protein C0Z16_36330, partial [Paraburkholderia rhynchosiae]
MRSLQWSGGAAPFQKTTDNFVPDNPVEESIAFAMSDGVSAAFPLHDNRRAPCKSYLLASGARRLPRESPFKR